MPNLAVFFLFLWRHFPCAAVLVRPLKVLEDDMHQGCGMLLVVYGERTRKMPIKARRRSTRNGIDNFAASRVYLNRKKRHPHVVWSVSVVGLRERESSKQAPHPCQRRRHQAMKNSPIQIVLGLWLKGD